ncbi:MAG TPA: serine hydrolase [Saprospiraceae bacterium]|nr:serine hydrolase [Saprospiraceae bacterium]
MKITVSKIMSLLFILFLAQASYAQVRIKRSSGTTIKRNTRVVPSRTIPSAASSYATVAVNSPWVARHNLTGSAYQSEFSKWSKKGYRLTHISGYGVGNKAYYAAIWEKKSGPAYATHHGMSAASYQQKFTDYAKKGYRVTHISGYYVNGKDYYAAIWEKKSGPAYVARHRLNGTQYQQEFNKWKAKGYRLVHITGYEINRKAHYAAIWEKKSGPALATHHGMSAATYQQKFNQYSSQGYRLEHLSAYTVSGKDYYAAIWEKQSGPAYSARHRLNAANYQAEFDNHYYTGYRPRLVSGYTINGKTHFAAIWDAGKIKASDLSKISSKVQQFLSKHNIAGLQVAVSKDEKLMFSRGYGKADLENNLLMGPNHKGRIASISKPITSAAIHKLDLQDNGFSMTSKVFGPASIFGNTYGTNPLSAREKAIRVAHLLEHTAGANTWDNNGFLEHTPVDPQTNQRSPESPATGDPMFSNTNMSHAQLFSWVLNNRNPDYTPGDYYAYSNFGYSVLGRIIEKRTNQSYEAWVRNNILKPAGAGGMFISKNSRAQKRVNEMVYYGGNPYGANVYRMDSHGGWAGSTIDLLRFMAHVDGRSGKKDVIPASAVSSMKSRNSYSNNPVNINMGYGKGWGVFSNGVNHNGSLSGTFSWLEWKDNGMAFALIINSNPGTAAFRSEFGKLGDEIMGLISQWPNHDLF